MAEPIVNEVIDINEARNDALSQAPEVIQQAYKEIQSGHVVSDSLGVVLPDGNRVQMIKEAEERKVYLHPGDYAISQAFDECVAVVLKDGKLVEFLHNTGFTPRPTLQAQVLAFNNPNIDLSDTHTIMQMVIDKQDECRLQENPIDEVQIIGRQAEIIAKYFQTGTDNLSVHKVTPEDGIEKGWKYDVWLTVSKDGKTNWGLIPSLRNAASKARV